MACQDNVTELDIGTCCWWPDFPVVQHCEVILSCTCADMTLAVAWMKNPKSQQKNPVKCDLSYLA